MTGPLLETLYIVRHGETDWNVKKIMQGHKGTELNEKGKIQAQEIDAELKDIHFDAIFSSDLLRAKQTAEIMALERQMAVKTTELLRERRLGKFEGQPYDSMNELGVLLKKIKDLTPEEKSRFEEADVETSEEMIGRFIRFVREIAVAYAGKNVLVVSHGGMIRLLLLHLGYSEYITAGGFANGGYLKLRSDGVDFFLDEVKGVVNG